MQGIEFRYAQFFAIIAKVTVHRDNLKFRYAQIFAKLAKFIDLFLLEEEGCWVKDLGY